MIELIKDILNKEKLNYNKITKVNSGFTSIVYFVDDMVIKLALQEEKKKKLKKEIDIYKNISLNNIPQYIASGEFNNYIYLIISKISGKSLYKVWHNLTEIQRANCIEQIAKTLKGFNKQNAEFLNSEYKIIEWEESVLGEFRYNINEIEKLGINTENVSKFVSSTDLFKDNVFGLVYNDAHFDNFIYDKGKIYLIDFDRVVYAPIDYEMLIFKTMCDNPSKFASEEDESNVFNEDFIKVYAWFNKYYKEIFEIKNIDKRIKIYQFNYHCKHALNMNNREFSKEWLKELVDEFRL
jgi:hypothetical protein